MLETFVPYVHEVVVRYMAQSWVLQKLLRWERGVRLGFDSKGSNGMYYGEDFSNHVMVVMVVNPVQNTVG